MHSFSDSATSCWKEGLGEGIAGFTGWRGYLGDSTGRFGWVNSGKWKGLSVQRTGVSCSWDSVWETHCPAMRRRTVRVSRHRTTWRGHKQFSRDVNPSPSQSWTCTLPAVYTSEGERDAKIPWASRRSENRNTLSQYRQHRRNINVTRFVP